MPKIIDMTGQVFGKLYVLSRVPATGQARWLCNCSCGEQTIQAGYDLRKGLIVSCGCTRREKLAVGLFTTHGMTRTKEYIAWLNMRNRCYRTNSRDYERYGAKGIIVCDAWRDSFESFFLDMGKCPEGYSLDRVDSSANYESSNCRWASLETQANNKLRIKTATINGVTKSLAIWCKQFNLPHRTIRARVYERGWEPERAILTPIRKRNG